MIKQKKVERNRARGITIHATKTLGQAAEEMKKEERSKNRDLETDG